jgi:hypothetical protein
MLMATAGYAWFARSIDGLQDWWRYGVLWSLGA